MQLCLGTKNSIRMIDLEKGCRRCFKHGGPYMGRCGIFMYIWYVPTDGLFWNTFARVLLAPNTGFACHCFPGRRLVLKVLGVTFACRKRWIKKSSPAVHMGTILQSDWSGVATMCNFSKLWNTSFVGERSSWARLGAFMCCARTDWASGQ